RSNWTEWLKSFPPFQCPSDPNSKAGVNNTNYMGVSGGGNGTAATESCNYVSGANTVRFYKNGVLYRNSSTSLGDIKDGTAFQFLVGESKYQLIQSARGDTRRFGWASARRTNSTAGGGAKRDAAPLPANVLKG